MTPEELIESLNQDDRGQITYKPWNGNPNVNLGFPNGWGASIIWDGYGKESGLMEAAVTDGFAGSLTYTTPITNDVVGYLNDAELLDLLDQIRRLPDNPSPNDGAKYRRGDD